MSQSGRPQSTSPIPAPVTLRSADGKLAAHFFWNGDRFAHRIEHAEGQKLESIEGDQLVVNEDVSSDWPCSPPIQQLSLEEINGGPVVLGVGSAGAGHWSLSVEQTDHGFRFDVACRYKSAAKWLGSCYRISEQFVIRAEQDSLIGVQQGNDARDSSAESCEAISPNSAPEVGTARWQYEVT